MFLDLKVPCDQNKKSRPQKNWLLKSGIKKVVGGIVRASETANECRQFHVFVLFSYIFLGASKAIFKIFFMNLRAYDVTHFFYLLECLIRF